MPSMATTSVRCTIFLKFTTHALILVMRSGVLTHSLLHLFIIQFIKMINEEWWKLCIFKFSGIVRIKETLYANAITTTKFVPCWSSRKIRFTYINFSMCWMGKNARFQIVPYSVQFGSVHVLFGLPTPVTRSEKKQRNFPKQKKTKLING